MSDLNDMKQYLLSIDIPSDDKRYTMNFCKKMSYLDNLKQVMIKELHQPIISGYGNVNSKICFITKNNKMLETIKSLLESAMDKFHINIWDVYITFVDKCNVDYPHKFSFLAHELSAVQPEIIYYIDNSKDNYNSLLNAFNTNGIKRTDNIYYIDVAKLISSDISDRKELWSVLNHMIKYKPIIREE